MSILRTSNIKNALSSTSNITLDSDGKVICASDLQATSINGGGLGKNWIMNPDFRIWQRGTSQTVNGIQYVADRWQAETGASGIVARNTAPTNLPFDYVHQFSSNGEALRQAIELEINDAGDALPGPFVEGSTWTLSLYANFDITGIIPRIAFRSNLQSSNNQTLLMVPTPAYAAIGPEVDGYTRYSTTITVGAGRQPQSGDQMLAIVVFDGATSIPPFGSVGGIQFEQSPVATPFESRPIGLELALCQRYYQEINFFRVLFNGNSSAGQATVFQSTFSAMRTTTATVSSLNGNAVLYYSTGRSEGNIANNAQTAILFGGVNDGRAYLTINRVSASTSANLCTVGGSGADSRYSFDAEL